MRSKLLSIGAIGLTTAALLAGPMTAAADPWQELAALASNFPADTDIYVGLRTDDAYIATLDGILQRVNTVTANPNPQSLMTILDQAAVSVVPGGSFSETLRPAFGDEAALAVGDLSVLFDDKPENDNAVELALAIRLNSEGAAFIDGQLGNEMIQSLYTVESVGGGTLYRPNDIDDTPAFIFYTDEIAVVSNSERMLPFSDSARLSEDTLAPALDQLPEDDYNIVVWIDVGAILQSVVGNVEMLAMGMPELESQLDMIRALEDTYLGQAWGLTILDDRSLTIDIAQGVDLEVVGAANPAALASFGLPPLDSAFFERIPAGSALVAAGNGISQSVDAALAQFEALGDEGQTTLQQLDFVLRAATGQNLEEISAWMDGNYAVVLTPDEALAGLMTGVMPESLPVDFGFVVETSDAAAGADFVANVAASLKALPEEDGTSIDSTTDTIADVEVDVVTIRTPDLPFPIEVVLGSNSDVVAIGSRAVVTAALDSEPDFAADADLAEAQTYALPGSYTFLYMSGNSLASLGAIVAGGMMGPGMNAGQPDPTAVITGLLSTATITSTTNADTGLTLIRLVWTLPAE